VYIAWGKLLGSLLIADLSVEVVALAVPSQPGRALIREYEELAGDSQRYNHDTPDEYFLLPDPS
jgi:hypothetical protein